MAAVMSGETHLMFPAAAAAAPHVKSGRLRALAVGSVKPSEFLPGVPTMAAAGVAGYLCEALHALFAPAGTPASIVTRLNQETVRYLQTPEPRELLFKFGVETLTSSPDEVTSTMKSEIANIGKILKAAGIGTP
jgi:tripartite-type tricarboxylate transporter receptor subunit TctC